jgi:tetratricopeptide (TPR) repeat protein
MTRLDSVRPAERAEEALALIAQSHQASISNQFVEAEIYLRKAIELDDGLPMAHNNLGWALHKQGRLSDAIESYRNALTLNGSFTLAQINLSSLFASVGRIEEARNLWRVLAAANPRDRRLLNSIVSDALGAGDIRTAASVAEQYATVCRGFKESRWGAGDSLAPDSVTPVPMITIDKLKHDIEQFQYLKGQGVLAIDLGDIIERYQRALERKRNVGHGVSFACDDETSDLIGHVYGRLVHLRETPRLDRALSAEWDADAVEKAYCDHPHGLIVVDDFLSPDALTHLRQFCLQSTVWFGNRYAHGRLGAFFRDGFNPSPRTDLGLQVWPHATRDQRARRFRGRQCQFLAHAR